MTKKNTGKKLTDTTIKTPPFRIDWPFLLTPQEDKEDASKDPKYSVKMVFDDKTTDYSIMLDALKEVAKPIGGFDKLNEDKQCLRDTPNNQIDKYGEDTKVASASSIYPITVVDANRQAVTDESQIIKGSYAIAIVKPSSYNVNKSKGVKFYLQAVQLLGGGTRFAGGIDVKDVFDEEEDRGATLAAEDGDW